MAENIVSFPISEETEFPTGVLNIEVTKEKPFNQCFSCEYFRNGCSGPNLNVMSVERVCEFLQLCRIKAGYTYQTTADLSGLSLVTVKRTLTDKNKDPGWSTIQALASVLVGDPNGKYPCALHIVEKQKENVQRECDALQHALDACKAEHALNIETVRANDRQSIEYLKQQIAFKEEQMRTKDEQLMKRATEQHELHEFVKRKNRVIGMLSFVLAICVILIITALVVDLMNSDMGFFWLDKMANFFNISHSEQLPKILEWSV